MGEKLNFQLVYFETNNGIEKMGVDIMGVGLETIFDIGETEF